MAIHIYHPSKTVKGSAASFWYSSRENCVFATILKQSGWDEASQNGTFKDSMDDENKRVNIKLSAVEVGSILEVIDKNREFKTYHDNEVSPKTIAFIPWVKDDVQKGFTFSVNVANKQDSTQSKSFFIGLNFGEARLIKEYLTYSLCVSFISKKENNSQNKVEDKTV